MPYFTWLERFYRQHWNQTLEKVRFAVEDYLSEQMRCQIKEHKEGFHLIYPTASTPPQVRMWLVALKRFYKVMIKLGKYAHKNPLIDERSELLKKFDEYLEEDQYPRMPSISGVVEVDNHRRLTDSYYKFKDDEWIPHLINDSTFPAQILTAGRELNKWNDRAEIVTRILFESGCRVSEVTGLLLADWLERGSSQEANTFSKGSGGRRVKYIRFSSSTAKLLRRYVNTERIQSDPNRATLDDYINLFSKDKARCKVPLFLTSRGTMFSPENYRDNYWKPVCQKANITADVHQCRHFYVTMRLKQIYESGLSDEEIVNQKKALQDYMKWRSEDTIKAYDHYFDKLRYTEYQDQYLNQLEVTLTEYLETRQDSSTLPGINPSKTTIVFAETLKTPEDEDLQYLRKIGGRKQ